MAAAITFGTIARELGQNRVAAGGLALIERRG